MTIENDNPNAQGPATDPDGQAQNSNPAPQSAGGTQGEGFQKRIDELTAKFHDSERRREAETSELRQLNQQLLLAVSQGVHQQVQQAPAVDVDPEVRKAVEAVMAPYLQQTRQSQAQMLAGAGNAQLEAVVQGQHPDVAKRTRQIWADAVAKGAHTTGFSPVQALTWARGELADVLIADARKTQHVQQGQHLNAQPQVITSQSVVAPPSGSQHAKGAPPDMDEDPAAASAWYAQQLGDKPF